MFGFGRKTQRFASGVFLFFFCTRLRDLQLLFMYYVWTVAAKFDFSPSSQLIRTHRALFTDPQISLFSNFFIKNESHGTIHTFKNYFATMFFSFQFQFLVFSYIQTDPVSLSLNTFPHIFSITKQKYGNSRERWNVFE